MHVIIIEHFTRPSFLVSILALFDIARVLFPPIPTPASFPNIYLYKDLLITPDISYIEVQHSIRTKFVKITFLIMDRSANKKLHFYDI